MKNLFALFSYYTISTFSLLKKKKKKSVYIFDWCLHWNILKVLPLLSRLIITKTALLKSCSTPWQIQWQLTNLHFPWSLYSFRLCWLLWTVFFPWTLVIISWFLPTFLRDPSLSCFSNCCVHKHAPRWDSERLLFYFSISEVFSTPVPKSAVYIPYYYYT